MHSTSTRKPCLGNFNEFIGRVEESKSTYICTKCTVNYAFSSWEEFRKHSCIIKSKDSTFECVYCGLLISLVNGENHIQMHFQHQYNNLYQCSLCTFATSTDTRFVNHTNSMIHINSEKPIIYKCRCCQRQFEAIDQLIKHVKYYTVVMFNCCIKNCLARSRFKNIVLNHYTRCHPSKNPNLEIILFLSCNEKSPDILMTNQLLRKYNNLEKYLIYHETSLSSIKDNNNNTSCFGHALYLKCPKCTLNSLSWTKFIRHYFTCKPNGANNDSNYIYLCSYCHSVTTDLDIIEEHIIECNKDAYSIKEPLPEIKEEEMSTNKPVKRNHSNNGSSEFNCPPMKRSKTHENSEGKCKTEEVVLYNKEIIENAEQEREWEEEEVEFRSNDGDEMIENHVIKKEEYTITEFISIPFDEEAFVANNSLMPPNLRTVVINKMRQFSKYQVKIMGKENYGRIPQCPECKKIFNYGFGDFKRHFIAVHLEMEKDYIKECLKYTKIPKIGDKIPELPEQIAMRNMRPTTAENDCMKIPLPYSINGLKKLTECLTNSAQSYLAEKMQIYSTMSVNIQSVDNQRRFLCNQCSYSSPYALADVRKHIMGSHCGISTKHFRFCLQASRLDPNEFQLLSDDKILTFAKEVTRRIVKSVKTSKPKPVKSSPIKSIVATINGPSGNVVSTIGSFNMYTRSQDFSWSAKRKKNYKNMIAGKEPIQSNSTNNVYSTEENLPSLNVNLDDTPNTSAITNNSSIPLSQPSLGGRKGVNALYLDADTSYNLTLPYSENVLNILLPTMVSKDQIPGIIQKMKLYSNYTLKRLCKSDRTVAFQCPCGRVFHTARIPDLKMRAATLADARRHVMGVHAKIPQSLITLCCQASRICRENDFQIYSDEMLLQLASERQSKLPEQSQVPLKSSNEDSSTCNSLIKNTDSLSPVKLICSNIILYKQEPTLEPSQNTNLNMNSVISPNVNNSACSSLENTAPIQKTTNSFLNNSFQDEDNCLFTKFPDLSDEIDSQSSHQFDENALARLETETEKVERVINLPYSLGALKCLTDGYCEPSFFPVLQEKMEIYSRYKIFIVRRENRRVFCCSGCPSSSPHGMGDVKKHILGVHARIPERFKAAAMHCSRLSREDTSLLPDHLLLQLAKMKWKGSVIKPLSELSVEDRLKTFSKKNRDNKSKNANRNATGINRSYSMVSSVNNNLNKIQARKSLTNPILNNINLSPVNHIKQEYKQELDFSMDDHWSVNGSASEIIIPDEFHVEIASNSTVDEISYKCSICEYESRFVGNTKGHIVREHLGIPQHSCNICEQLFNSRASAEAHHEKDHGDLAFTLTHYGPYKIAMGKIEVQDHNSIQLNISGCSGMNINNNTNNNNSTNNKSSNSFLQNDFDLCLI